MHDGRVHGLLDLGHLEDGDLVDVQVCVSADGLWTGLLQEDVSSEHGRGAVESDHGQEAVTLMFKREIILIFFSNWVQHHGLLSWNAAANMLQI